MRATGINHVSIPCRDLDESETFYRDAFGLERIPSPIFRRPVRWLALGTHQLHLMETPDDEPLEGQHFGFDVDDFEAAFLKLDPDRPRIRLLGVTVSGLATGPPKRQLELAGRSRPGWDEASEAIDDIRERFGDEAVGVATLLGGRRDKGPSPLT